MSEDNTRSNLSSNRRQHGSLLAPDATLILNSNSAYQSVNGQLFGYNGKMEAVRWQEQARHSCPVRDNSFTFVRNRGEEANGQTRPARSAHAGIAPQSTDFPGLGEALRLDHGPGSSRSS